MVFVKIRETYDLHTIRDKLSVIGIHTPTSNIIKRTYPGLLMQTKAYRPVSCDVKMACASMLPLDPLGIGTAEGDVAPEDVFNPILYKACSNKSMSQIEQYLHIMTADKDGPSIDVNFSGVVPDDFNLYYGLLSQTHDWKHANPQSGVSMIGLKPLVYETYDNIGTSSQAIDNDGLARDIPSVSFRGSAHPMPFLETTVTHGTVGELPTSVATGFNQDDPDHVVNNIQIDVPSVKTFCGIMIIPPSRLHQLFYRLVCEWTLEFSTIRQISEITSWTGLQHAGKGSHYISYSFDDSKFVESTGMVDTTEGMGIKKVM